MEENYSTEWVNELPDTKKYRYDIALLFFGIDELPTEDFRSVANL
jgi:hypothetical protein